MRTTQEAIAAVAAGRGALLLCRTTAEYHRRPDVRFVPVRGVPDSQLGLVWARDHESARVLEFARVLAAAPEAITPIRS
ncbi:hypothetical protein [Nocardia sp. NPDC051570]|uniref:hypothetical protein n=1 Tax=Nocardia sp. NPDC051570 TaxID=3364324 RepID=UPI0037A9C0AE